MAASGNGRSGGGGSSSNCSSAAVRNHPFRLEVQDITPVSASILWSLRPPPLSAIPRTLLRQQKQPLQQRHHHTSPSNTSSASSSTTQASRFPVNRLAGEAGVTATRSVNRKVTKVTLRNISPNNKTARLSRQGQLNASNIESEEWPSDDEITAVDDDEQRDDDDADNERTLDDDSNRLNPDDCSEASEDGTASAKIFDSGVSVCVNGVPWSQVMMGDRRADEAFMVVYGLSPSREYELLLKVQGGEQQQSAVVAVSTAADPEERSVAPAVQQASASIEQTRNAAPSSSTLRTHTPPMQDTDASPIDGPSESSGFPLVPAATTSTNVSAAAIQASIRRARKDASRAESALRSEIEAIKRGLERMSDVDHRSKQKVLALQESIRQATQHAKEIEEEASEVEAERGEWEKKEREKEEELQDVKRIVEENIRQGDAKTKQDDEEVEAVEKELQKITKVLEDKWHSKLRIERERVAEAEQELMRVQMEIDNLLRPQQYSQHGNHFYSPVSQAGSVPSQGGLMSSRGKGRAPLKSSSGNRSTSSPAVAAPTSRKTYNRLRGQGYSNASDEVPYEYQGASSSSTHGSTLNPHNPEFIPASASPVVSKVGVPEYSPSPASRFAFYNRDHDSASHSPMAHLNTPSSAPWSTTSASPNQTVGVPYWSTSTMNPSPTLGHDIWGAPPGNSSPLASIHQSPALSSLHTQTSIPFNMNKPPLRSPTHAASPSDESHQRFPSFNLPREDHQRRGSEPVSPSLSS
jgi:hypothetical protein